MLERLALKGSIEEVDSVASDFVGSHRLYQLTAREAKACEVTAFQRHIPASDVSLYSNT